MLHQMTVAELHNGLINKTFSSVELTEYFLKRIARYDNELNSFITITGEHALAEARRADERIAQGNFTTFTGIPIAHKDLFCTKHARTTCASRMLAEFIPPYDATVVARLAAQGAVMLGKLNMDEFGMGSSNETSYFGAVANPWSHTCVPGGSSGGSAACVAARLAPIATASDTGGSVRQPASFCGITGLKPTYGRVSRHGMVAYASSLDQAGILSQSAQDCALLLTAIAGHDKRDATCVNRHVDDYLAALQQPLDGLTLGIIDDYFDDDLSDEVQHCLNEAQATFSKLGVSLKRINLPALHYAIPAYYVIAPAEASSNLARYDGIRYGFTAKPGKDLNAQYTETRSAGFGAEVKRRIMTGTFVLSAGYHHAFYDKAIETRAVIAHAFAAAYEQVDCLLAPTTRTTAFPLHAYDSDPVGCYKNDRYTIAANLAGIPALSLPCGMVAGMPIGLQLMAPQWAESRLLQLAHHYQLTTDWHKQRPQQYQ